MMFESFLKAGRRNTNREQSNILRDPLFSAHQTLTYIFLLLSSFSLLLLLLLKWLLFLMLLLLSMLSLLLPPPLPSASPILHMLPLLLPVLLSRLPLVLTYTDAALATPVAVISPLKPLLLPCKSYYSCPCCLAASSITAFSLCYRPF